MPKTQDFAPINGRPYSTGEDWLDFVMEGRRLACDRRYRERLRQLKLRFLRAA
jgi:hypothetical protein